MNPWLPTVLLFAFGCAQLKAELRASVKDVRLLGHKADVHLELHNTHTQSIRSARAQVFLVGTNGQVMGQTTQWLIGGKHGPGPLPAGGTTSCHAVVRVSGEFAQIHVLFSVVTLADGTSGRGRNLAAKKFQTRANANQQE